MSGCEAPKNTVQSISVLHKKDPATKRKIIYVWPQPHCRTKEIHQGCPR